MNLSQSIWQNNGRNLRAKIVPHYQFLVRRITLSLLLYVVTIDAISSPNIHVHHSPLNPKITHPTITDLLIDRSGFFWVGTQQGLFKFEGQDVIVFDGNNSHAGKLESYDIRGIGQKDNGNIIISTFGGGVHELSQGSGLFTSLEIGDDLEIEGLYSLGNDYFLAAGKKGVFSLNLSEGNELGWLTKALSDANISDVVDSIIINRDNTIIATENSIIHVSFSARSIKEKQLNFVNEKATSIALKDSTEVYVSTSESRLQKIRIDDHKVISTLDLTKDQVGKISEIEYFNRQLWIATNNGLFLASPELEIESHLNESTSKISNNNVTRMLYHNGILFLGTFDGLNQIVPSSIRSFNRQNSNIDNDVLTFAETSDGTLWIGTYAGLYKYDRSRQSHSVFPDRDKNLLPDSRITALAVHQNDLLIGLAQHGVHQIDTVTGEYTSIAGDGTNILEITDILVTAKSGIFVSSYSDGVYQIISGKLFRVPTGTDTSFNQLFETSQGHVLASTERKLFRFDTQRKVFVNLNLNFPRSNDPPPLLLSMAEDPNGDLLLGTKGRGIYVLLRDRLAGQGGDLRAFGANQALDDSIVYDMLLDENLNLWCSTHQGIFKIQPSETIEFRLTKLDGLQANDFNFGAAFKSSEGKLYFGGISGYSLLDADQSRPINRVAPIAITKISVGYGTALSSNEVSRLQNLRLSYKGNSFRITINLLDYQNPTANHYTYKLEGFDNSWVEAGTQNIATYTNLEPGTYNFRAKGANAAGMWSENEVSLDIIIAPAWWKTWSAYTAYGLLAILMFWAGLRTYRSHLLKEQALRIAREMQDATDQAQDDLLESEEYQDELVRAVSMHNLATLDLISKCLGESGELTSSHKKVQGHIKALELIEKQYFFQENELVADMHAYTDSLINLLLQQTSIDATTVTTINRVTYETIPASIASTLAIIVYELLHNSLSHAFPANSSSNFVEVCLDIAPKTSDSTRLILSVADNGIGISAAVCEGRDIGTGLRIVRQLSKKLDAEYCVTSIDSCKTQISLQLAALSF